MPTFEKILIANRGEIAIRVMRAANEMGKRTVAVFAEEDKLCLHRFKADEAYRIGEGLGPVAAYLSIPEIIRVAKMCGADAIHPGYGLLSENPDFVDACDAAGIAFIGPTAETMRMLGDKASARRVAIAAGRAGDPGDRGAARRHGRGAPHGRGGRLSVHAQGVLGRRRARHAADHGPGRARGQGARGPARGAERLRQRRGLPREDDPRTPATSRCRSSATSTGTIYHLWERDCSVQRRNQKVVERAPAPYLTQAQREELCELGLQDRAGGQLRMRRHGRVPDGPRHGRLLLHRGEPARPGRAHRHRGGDRHRHRARPDPDRRGRDASPRRPAWPSQADVTLNGHAIQCRITTEDPQNNFIPDYGRITAYRGATGHGIRLDGGTAYSGAVITRYYDSLLEKVTAWAPTPEMAIARIDRALREFRIRGVSTNIAFVENLLKHPTFLDYYLHHQVHRHDARALPLQRAPRPGDEDPDLHRRHHRQRPSRDRRPAEAAGRGAGAEAAGGAARRAAAGHAAAARARRARRRSPTGCWRRSRLLVTDTTMRDGHQSLLATRMRSFDMIRVAPAYAADAAAALQRRVLGRGDLRRRLPLPAGMPLAAAARPARGDAEPDDADAAARLERRRLHQLSRQRGRGLRRRRRRTRASTSSACSTASTGSRTCASRWTR